MDTYASMTELLHKLSSRDNYEVYTDQSHHSLIKIFAPHGGCIEPATEPIALGIARERFDYFVFSGRRKTDCYRVLHVTGTHYDEPTCLEMVLASELSVAIHGSAESQELVHVGGGNKELATELIGELRRLGYPAVRAPEGMKGLDDKNFVNLARRRGIQLELSAGFRKTLFPSFPKIFQRNEPYFQRFTTSMKSWLSQIESTMDGVPFS